MSKIDRLKYFFCSHTSIIVNGCDKQFWSMLDYFSDVISKQWVPARKYKFYYADFFEDI